MDETPRELGAVVDTTSLSRDAVARILRIDPDAPTNPRELPEWLLLAHPNLVTRSEIAGQVAKLEARIASHHVVDGLVFPFWIQLTEDEGAQAAPRIDAVADTALFNGIHLAGLVAKYGVTRDPAVLREVGASVDAMHKLTHITGIPGLLARYALPLDRAIQSRVIPTPDDASVRTSFRHIYYDDARNVRPAHAHLRNIVAGRDGVKPVLRSHVGRLLSADARYGDQYFCTRASRDQLTGVVFGLAFAMTFFERDDGARGSGAGRELHAAIRMTVSRVAVDLYQYLRAHDWAMVDPVTGGGSGANDVSGLLRTAVELLFRRALMNQWTDETWRDDAGPSLLEQLDWFRQDTHGASLPRHIEPTLLWMRVTWRLTSRYYAWHLRLLRLISVLVLDDWHPATVENPPDGWRADALTRSATLRRNRVWLRVLDKAFWSVKGKCSDPWSTYLVNRIRADVFRRHLEDPDDFGLRHPDLDIYALSRGDFDRIAMVTAVHDTRALRKALFESHPEIGCELPRAHFHLRSLAIKPWRSHTATWVGIGRRGRARYQTHHPVSVYPPHLMKFFTNFIFEKDPMVALTVAEDAVGWSERTLIDLPVLYWMIVQDGQWRSQWDVFASEEFTPPGTIAAQAHEARAARGSGWTEVPVRSSTSARHA